MAADHRIVFITGTDTGVGKTLLTALLLAHLRHAGRNVLAMKPFCSGSRADAELLFDLQEREIPLEVVNPYYFSQPIAPLAATLGSDGIPLAEVTAKIRTVSTQCEVLLVEGSGGLLVPLGDGYTVADLVHKLACDQVLVVARNALGTINHTLLTLRYLLANVHPEPRTAVFLMESASPDASARTNPAVLQDFLPGIPVISLPNLGPDASNVSAVKNNRKKLEKTLARLLL